MNNNACNDATDRPLYLNNEVNLDAAVFAIAAPAPTVSAATALTSNIIPDSHIPQSGQKQHTKPFSPVNMNKIYKKEKIKTNPVPEDPTDAPAESFTWYPGLTVSNSPYSLRNRNFTTSPISTKKSQKRQKDKKDK